MITSDIYEKLKTAYIYQQTYLPEQYVDPNSQELCYYNSSCQRFKQDYNIHMNEEYFTETNKIIFPTPLNVAKLLKILTDETTVLQVRVTKRRGSQQLLEYVESYKNGTSTKLSWSQKIIDFI